MKLSKTQTNIKEKARKRLCLRNEFDAWVLMFPMLFILYVFVWRPTVMGFVWSFFKMQAYNIVSFCGFDNYVKVLTNSQFIPMLWNTVQYVLWSLVIGFFPPLFLRFRTRRKRPWPAWHRHRKALLQWRELLREFPIRLQ